MSSDAPDLHRIASSHLGNLRDVGGRPTSDGGEVARGVVFRSAELADDAIAADPDLATLAVRTVVDLRTAAERTSRPDVVPAGADLVTLDVLADLPGGAAAKVADLMARPGGLAAGLAGVDMAEQMRETYRALVTLPSARARRTRRSSDWSSTPSAHRCCSTAPPARTARAGRRPSCSRRRGWTASR